MSDYDMFKTTLMGGFDKDDVIQQFQDLKDNAYREKTHLEKELKEREEKIAELTKRLALKETQREKLERDISEKYQKYIDNYDSISKLVFDARVQSDQMLEDARKKSEQMLREAEEEADRRIAEADQEAQRRLGEAQQEVNEKLADGKKKYIAIQEEMGEIVELINQAQKRFMASFKEVHQIVSSMPDSLRELEDDAEDTLAAGDEALDDADELSDEEIEELFEFDK